MHPHSTWFGNSDESSSRSFDSSTLTEEVCCKAHRRAYGTDYGWLAALWGRLISSARARATAGLPAWGERGMV